MNKLLISILVAVSATGTVQAATGDAAAGQGKTAVCAGCHGADGNSLIPNFPKLAGQNKSYLIKQMAEIKSGKRPVVEMTGLLDAFSDKDLADIAAYFASQTSTPGVAARELVEQGQKIYRAGIVEKGVAACTACHLPTGVGNSQAAFPKVSGQHAAYAVKQLTDFRAGSRSNDPQEMMQDITSKLTDAEIKAVSSYIQGLRK